MSTPEVQKRWQRHMGVFKNATERQAEMTKFSKPIPHLENKALLAGLANSLRDFGADQMQFFANGFASNFLVPKDKENTEFPEEYILGVTSRQIAHDLSVIERAVDQRRDVEKRNILKQADVIASAALVRAAPFLDGGVWPVTYLNKSPVIRVIPYAPVALIGIPYTAMNSINDNDVKEADNFDYLAIAHEVGHYVYWHGRSEDGIPFYEGLYNELKNVKNPETGQLLFAPKNATNQPLYAHWLEEIFADVFAAMVGGTATAYSIQEVVSDNLPKRMIVDDGEHPLAVLRPYIYTKALQEMGLTDPATSLEDHWEQSSAYSRVFPEELFPNGLNNEAIKPSICRYDSAHEKIDPETKQTFEQVKGDLQTIAGLICDALGINTDSKDEVWTKIVCKTSEDVAWTKTEETEKVDREAIIEVFNQKILDINRSVGMEWPSYEKHNGQQEGGWHFQGEPVSLRILNDLRARREEIQNAYADDPEVKILYWSEEPEDIKWKPVFQVGGWSSGGGDDIYPDP